MGTCHEVPIRVFANYDRPAAGYSGDCDCTRSQSGQAGGWSPQEERFAAATVPVPNARLAVAWCKPEAMVGALTWTDS